jgi:hypothetical protein
MPNASPISLRLAYGGIVTMDPDRSAVESIIAAAAQGAKP